MTDNNFPFQKTDAYQAARALASGVFALKIRHGELRDQAERAACSVHCNLSEGAANDPGGIRRRYLVTARNSLCELVAVLDLACAIEAAEEARVEPLLVIAKRLRGMVLGLMRV